MKRISLLIYFAIAAFASINSQTTYSCHPINLTGNAAGINCPIRICITQTIDCSHQQGPCNENGANGTITTQTNCFEIDPNNMSGAQYCMWSNGNNATPCDCEITTTSISFALINNVGPPYETCTYTGGLATTIGNILNGSSSGSYVIDFNTDCEKFPHYWRIDISPDGNGGINLNFH